MGACKGPQDRLQQLQRIAEACDARLRLVEALAEASKGADFVLDAAGETIAGTGGAAIDARERSNDRDVALQALLVNTMG